MTDCQFLRTLVDNKQKNTKKYFKKFSETKPYKKSLQIIIKCNLKIVYYLDVTLNFNDGTYRHFHNSNEETTYIHVESDHPRKLSRKFQDLLKKDYPDYLQQRKYLKIRKITMSSVEDNVDITKNKLH